MKKALNFTIVLLDDVRLWIENLLILVIATVMLVFTLTASWTMCSGAKLEQIFVIVIAMTLIMGLGIQILCEGIKYNIKEMLDKEL